MYINQATSKSVKGLVIFVGGRADLKSLTKEDENKNDPYTLKGPWSPGLDGTGVKRFKENPKSLPKAGITPAHCHRLLQFILV